MNTYFFEVTDTYGAEANYSWVRRYKVKASTMTGAIRKVNKEEGYGRLRKDSYGDLCRWDVVGACICIFGSDWVPDGEQRAYKELS